MSANNSSCHTFSDRELDTIFYTRIGVAALSFVACLVALILMCALICYLKVWKTLVHRLKLYLTAIALLLSIMYLLQASPMKSQAVQKETADNWNGACKGIAFLQQYVDWIMLLAICWMIVYLLWLLQPLLRGLGKAFDTLSLRSKIHFEIAAIVFTLTFPLLFLWTPFTTNDYGLADIWCGIIIRPHSDCSNKNGSLGHGLGYLIGTWYGPSFIVALLCTVGVIVVACIWCFWVYYKKKGRTKYMATAVLKGIPPCVYLLIYNVITCVDIASLLYHYTRNIQRGGETDYNLWLTHAVTGPSRALAVPFAFVLSHFLIRYCFRKKEDTYEQL